MTIISPQQYVALQSAVDKNVGYRQESFMCAKEGILGINHDLGTIAATGPTLW